MRTILSFHHSHLSATACICIVWLWEAQIWFNYIHRSFMTATKYLHSRNTCQLISYHHRFQFLLTFRPFPNKLFLNRMWTMHLFSGCWASRSRWVSLTLTPSILHSPQCSATSSRILLHRFHFSSFIHVIVVCIQSNYRIMS